MLPEAIIDGCVETENGIITAVRRGKADGCAQSIDVHGQYLCPGFVEIHTHGAGGADFMDGTEEAFLTACRTHLQHGTTTIYPTLLAASNEELDTAIETFLRVKSRLGEEGITAPGIHLEGPYLNPEQKGAINEAFIRPPRRAEYEPFVQKYAGAIARWTIAPGAERRTGTGRSAEQIGGACVCRTFQRCVCAGQRGSGTWFQPRNAPVFRDVYDHAEKRLPLCGRTGEHILSAAVDCGDHRRRLPSSAGAYPDGLYTAGCGARLLLLRFDALRRRTGDAVVPREIRKAEFR